MTWAQIQKERAKSAKFWRDWAETALGPQRKNETSSLYDQRVRDMIVALKVQMR